MAYFNTQFDSPNHELLRDKYFHVVSERIKRITGFGRAEFQSRLR